VVTSGQYQRATGRLPNWYLKQPLKIRGDEFYLHAYSVLQTERRRSVRVEGGKLVSETSPIPWSSALLYAEKIGLSRQGQLWFANVILSLESERREREREEQAAEQRRQKRRERRAAAQGRRHRR